ADEDIALITVLINFLSAIWSYFCISASLDRRSRAYDLMHDTELAWNALWTSCQTFALLVSFTNLSLLFYIATRVYASFVDTVKAQADLRGKITWLLVGIGCVLVGAPMAFLPWKLT
ncbi:hypothetical protein L873DRAFT_1648884, partial [Choiromyces venosus 120613-1]